MVEIKSQPKGSHRKRIAAVASILPGLGQLYNRQWLKGFFFLFIGFACLYYLYYYIRSIFIFPPLIPIFIFWFYNIYDAHENAVKS